MSSESSSTVTVTRSVSGPPPAKIVPDVGVASLNPRPTATRT